MQDYLFISLRRPGEGWAAPGLQQHDLRGFKYIGCICFPALSGGDAAADKHSVWKQKSPNSKTSRSSASQSSHTRPGWGGGGCSPKMGTVHDSTGYPNMTHEDVKESLQRQSSTPTLPLRSSRLIPTKETSTKAQTASEELYLGSFSITSVLPAMKSTISARF